ncbi:MAG: hypothetical protein COB93_08200 [Sneathiella sp.]|nr:MAG: hypothetical protein COB93_08200 [Sneathiella sp.]
MENLSEGRWIAACTTDEVDDTFGTRVDIEGGDAIAIFRVNDAYYATADRCTHGNASLCEGIVEGKSIECPFHMGTFDVTTGKALTFPCVVNLATYPVSLNDGQILVRIDAPTTIPSLVKEKEL